MVQSEQAGEKYPLAFVVFGLHGVRRAIHVLMMVLGRLGGEGT